MLQQQYGQAANNSYPNTVTFQPIQEAPQKTEMSKAILQLHDSLDMLIQRNEILRGRLMCVLMPKPTNPTKDEDQRQYPVLIQEVLTAIKKTRAAIDQINDLIDGLEI